MKSLSLITAAILAASITVSQAADPVYSDQEIVPIDDARFDWSGGYLGGVIDYGWRLTDKKRSKRLCQDSVLNSLALTSNLRAGPGAHAHTGFLSGIRVPRLCIELALPVCRPAPVHAVAVWLVAKPSAGTERGFHDTGLKGSSERLRLHQALRHPRA